MNAVVVAAVALAALEATSLAAPTVQPGAATGPAPAAKAGGIRKVNWKKQLKGQGDFGGVKYADLDGDGSEEALVVTSNDLPIRTETSTRIFTMSGGKVTEFASPSLPDVVANAAIVGSVEMVVRDKRLVVTYTFGEAECCVGDELITTFAWQKGDWVEDKTTRRLKRDTQ